MISFDEAFDKTMGHEGVYSNDSDDLGGETYRGISRRFYPTWQGWRIIDGLRRGSLPRLTDTIQKELDLLTRQFYQEKYWNKFGGDKISFQPLAEELFDTSVNLGVGRAVKFLQIALNCLNRNQAVYDDLTEDGIFGLKTLGVLNCMNGDDLKLIFKMLNVLQGIHYITIMQSDPTQEKFCRGWFKRVTILKE